MGLPFHVGLNYHNDLMHIRFYSSLDLYIPFQGSAYQDLEHQLVFWFFIIRCKLFGISFEHTCIDHIANFFPNFIRELLTVSTNLYILIFIPWIANMINFIKI